MFTLIVQEEHCEHCERAKALLHTLRFEFKEIKLDTESKKNAFDRAGFTTVPQIYHNHKLIGGFEDLINVIRDRFEGASFVHSP